MKNVLKLINEYAQNGKETQTDFLVLCISIKFHSISIVPFLKYEVIN